jgi:hypothetical protein
MLLLFLNLVRPSRSEAEKLLQDDCVAHTAKNQPHQLPGTPGWSNSVNRVPASLHRKAAVWPPHGLRGIPVGQWRFPASSGYDLGDDTVVDHRLPDRAVKHRENEIKIGCHHRLPIHGSFV